MICRGCGSELIEHGRTFPEICAPCEEDVSSWLVRIDYRHHGYRMVGFPLMTTEHLNAYLATRLRTLAKRREKGLPLTRCEVLVYDAFRGIRCRWYAMHEHDGHLVCKRHFTDRRRVRPYTYATDPPEGTTRWCDLVNSLLSSPLPT